MAQNSKSVHAYNSVESESRIFLAQTKLKDREEIKDALVKAFGLRGIRNYEFNDYYFSRDNCANGETTRAREWLTYRSADGVETKQKVQVVTSAPTVESYDGIPFKMGGKKSKLAFETVAEAVASIEKDGLRPWITVRKRNGEYYDICLEGVEARIAFEDIVCVCDGEQKSTEMAEIEVMSLDRATVARTYMEILAVLGLDKKELIGEPMIAIADGLLKRE